MEKVNFLHRPRVRMSRMTNGTDGKTLREENDFVNARAGCNYAECSYKVCRDRCAHSAAATTRPRSCSSRARSLNSAL
jgi:hypothetical protein